MTDLVVHPLAGGACLAGSVPVPSDKSIGHRALLLSAIATGTSRIRGFSRGGDNLSTLGALRALGVTVREIGPTELEVHGVGLTGLRAPDSPIDCGNSGTTMRLLAGILCAQPWTSRLVGDDSLTRRPMMRVIAPLRARGATLDGAAHPTRADERTAPLTISAPRSILGPLEYDSPVSSAQVKSAILLSGLYADGSTVFNEPTISRDHTERMLRALGVPLSSVASTVALLPAAWDRRLLPLDLDIPGDLSAAAFVLVGAQIVPGSRVTVRDVGINPTRTGLFEIARDMGAGLAVEPTGERGGEPVGTVHAWHAPLVATRAGGERVARAIDEICVACVLAARADGTTQISGAGELRVKESDRLAMMAKSLRGFGVACEELVDGLLVEGHDGPLNPADVDSSGDHRIAMSAVLLALVATGPSKVSNVDCITTSFPRFVGTMRALGARIDVSS
jgi:3-phosphoshikimate 1-carboxyvinyltransferase